ncbi:hypothetical protein MTO96_001747 [Rhipicephalus appendiculatus]
MRCVVRFVCALALLLEMCSSEACYSFEGMLRGLRHPVDIVPLPERQVLVGEHRGVILQVPLGAPENAHVFLNITSQVATSNAPADERGLLSFVLDPDFAHERSVYVCYSAPSKQTGIDHETTVSRFAVSGHDSALKAVAEVVLLRVPQRDRRYNGGPSPIRAGPMPVRDDGRRRQQRQPPFRPVSSPPLPEVRLLCGDTGVEPHRPHEEVYLVKAGTRHGWPATNNDGLAADDSAPVYRYSRAGGQAIVAGVVYGGREMPALRGKFLYADFVHGSLHALQPVADQNTWISEDLCLEACDGQQSGPFHVLAIATDADGEPLVLTTTDLRNDVPEGVVYRLKDGSCQKSHGAFHATAFGPAIWTVTLAYAAR